MIRTLILLGALTWYSGSYVGQPLRCGSVGGASGIYDTTHEWIAVDIDYLGWECGDWVGVMVGGKVHYWRVVDSGPLHRFCTWYGGECVPIIGDLPEHTWEWGSAMSVQAKVWNVTKGLKERMGRER